MPISKRRKVVDPAYKGFIAGKPCIVCQLLGVKQTTRTEVAHVGPRGLGQKCSDRETIPLCGFEHHREGKYSQTKMGKRFWQHWGIDREALISSLNAEYERLPVDA